MKKLLLITILLMLTISLSADVSDYDGFDWVKWPRIDKVNFILGYWSAMICMEDIYFAKLENKPADEEGFTELPDNRFTIKGTVGDWVDEIDRFYEDYNNRDTSLWITAILEVCSDSFLQWANE